MRLNLDSVVETLTICQFLGILLDCEWWGSCAFVRDFGAVCFSKIIYENCPSSLLNATFPRSDAVYSKDVFMQVSNDADQGRVYDR